MKKVLLLALFSTVIQFSANAQSVYQASRSKYDGDKVVGIKSIKTPVTGDLALILNDDHLKDFGKCNHAYLSGVKKLPENHINTRYDVQFLTEDHKDIVLEVAVGSECYEAGGPCKPVLSYRGSSLDCAWGN